MNLTSPPFSVSDVKLIVTLPLIVTKKQSALSAPGLMIPEFAKKFLKLHQQAQIVKEITQRSFRNVLSLELS